MSSEKEYHKKEYSKKDCIDALSKVIDPEIGINIVDVGLVYRVDITDSTIEIDYTLTSPGCPLAETIQNDIVTNISPLAGDKTIVTKVVWTPPWSIDFMSEEARLELGYPI